MENVSKVFQTRRALSFCTPAVRPAVTDVSLKLYAGETLGLVGESGSGKSTLGRLALNFLAPTRGCIFFEGVDHKDRHGPHDRDLRRKMQMIFQDIHGALDPRWSVGAQLREPLDIHRIGVKAERRERAAAMMRRVGLDPDLMARRPSGLSGGQRQRVVIARAMMLEPGLIVCDEPVSALDLSVQARIMDLLKSLQAETGTAFLFISHDLRVVRRLAGRVAVLKAGRIVETGTTEKVYGQPEHDYTRRLLHAAGFGRPRRELSGHQILAGVR